MLPSRGSRGRTGLDHFQSLLSFLYSVPCSAPRTSTSNSSITPSTTLKLSIKPLTATLNILFVVALYSVRRTVSSEEWTRLESSVAGADCDMVEATIKKVRRTRGDSSLSTRKACRAADARRAVGRGRSMVLIRLSHQHRACGLWRRDHTKSKENQDLGGTS